MKKASFLIGFILLSLFFSGCGYTTKSSLPASLRMIHIEPFDNKIDFTTENGRNIYLPLLEIDVHNAVIERFQFDGNLKVSEPEQADLILKGALKNYARDILRYTDDDEAQEYRVRITVSLELWDTNKQEKMWAEPNFSGEATYFTEGSLASTEDAAVQEALTDLAQRIVERTIENW